jgi:DNA-binding NarL/FixJ family response regulator
MAADMKFLGEGATGPEAVALAMELQPDVLLLDVELLGFMGDEVVRRLQGLGFLGRVLAVSSHQSPQVVQRMLTSGAAGYLAKDEVMLYLLEAIRFLKTQPQAIWLSPAMQKKLAR